MNIKCSNCEKEFDVVVIKAMGIERPISDLCHPCRAIKRAEIEAIEKAKIEAEIEDRKTNWYRESGIPEKFRNENFETFKDRGGNTIKVKQVAEQYAVEFPKIRPTGYKSFGIFSPGMWGVGKSHLAVSIGKVILKNYASTMPQSPVYYITEPAMLRRIRSTYNKQGNETEDDVYNHLITVPLLIVDDMGKEEISDPRFVQRVWFSVINGRYENELPVIITANLNDEDIQKHLGGPRNMASFDRLFEMMRDNFWELRSTSKRQEL